MQRVRIAQGSEPLTAFRTPLGSFEYTVVPFGLSNAPAAFQRYINHVLRRWLGISCSAYVDDIYALVVDIVTALDKAGLQLDQRKSAFLVPETRFGVYRRPRQRTHRRPGQNRDAIRDWEVPKTVKGVRAFLGSTSAEEVFAVQ